MLTLFKFKAKYILKIFFVIVLFCSCESIEYKIDFCDEELVDDYKTIRAYKDYEKGLACAKEKGYPVFLFFSSFGCIGDHSFEDKVLLNRRMQKLLNDYFLAIGLYVDSPRKLPQEERIWVTWNGKEKHLETEGNKNTNIQIERFKNNSQPFFVILSSDGEQIGDSWGWTKDPKVFTTKMEAALKAVETNN